MAKPLRPKRGTTAKNDAFAGLASEITIDTDKHSIRVHDGVTAGGHEILPKAKNDELYEKAGRNPNDFLITATGTSDARPLANRFADTVNVKDFGAIGDGVTDDTESIQRAITSVKSGVVYVPAGTYYLPSDIFIEVKNVDNRVAPFSIIGQDARFTGSGRIVMRACVGVRIENIEAREKDLILFGAHENKFKNVKVSTVYFGTTEFTTNRWKHNFWNTFDGCGLQRAVTVEGYEGYANATTFIDCVFTGSATAGFSKSFDYAIELNANGDSQAWRFFGCDVSYHSTAVYNVGGANTDGEIELSFYGTYFDDKFPQPSSRNQFRLTTIGCHDASYNSIKHELSSVLTSVFDSTSAGHCEKFDGSSSVNLVANGDFATAFRSWVGYTGVYPISSATGGVVTETAGCFGRGVRVDMGLTDSKANAVYIRTNTTLSSRLTGTFVVRNLESVEREFNFSFFSVNSTKMVLKPNEWVVVRLTPNQNIPSGVVQLSVAPTDNSKTYSIEFGYLGITYGLGGPLLVPSVKPKERIFSVDVEAFTIAPNSTYTVYVSGSDFAYRHFYEASTSAGLVADVTFSAYVTNSTSIAVTFVNHKSSSVQVSSRTVYVKETLNL